MAEAVVKRGWRSEQGAQLVEFALVIPILLVIFAGMVDFALMLQRYQVVTNAAREGARIAVLPGYGPADVEARVAAYVQTGLGDNTITPVTTTTIVAVDPPGAAPAFPAAEVVVAITHNYLIIGPMIGLIGGGPIGPVTLTARTTMRVEGG